ncbi:MAG: hypothetical protein JXD18_00955 [Anaerolineae bacterium]|nr:hypothetical protein [Anaerolineae bacterium]
MAEKIGLHELLKQLRAELMEETPSTDKLFFVEGAEIELYVTATREAQGGIDISVLTFGGLEAGASTGREQGHKVTLKLKPLITYEEARKQWRAGTLDPTAQPLIKGPKK